MTALKYWDGATWQTMPAIQGPPGPQGNPGATIGPPLVSALPGSPTDGQEVYLNIAGVGKWHLRYDSGYGDAYKWDFLGGAAITHEVLANISTGSTTYVSLSGGPTVTVPNAGIYDFQFEADANCGAAGVVPRIALKFGAAAITGDDDTCKLGAAPPTNLIPGAAGRTMRRTVTTAGIAVVMHYLTSTNTSAFEHRRITATPIRVG